MKKTKSGKSGKKVGLFTRGTTKTVGAMNKKGK